MELLAPYYLDDVRISQNDHGSLPTGEHINHPAQSREATFDNLQSGDVHPQLTGVRDPPGG
jgi:hypothetical protein